MNITTVCPPNLGWLNVDLDDLAVEHLWKCTEKPLGDYKPKLVGVIEDSQIIVDTDNWFFNNVLIECCEQYAKTFYNLGNFVPNNQAHPYYLESLWVNYQKQNQFNPRHMHFGVYSFVIWMKIPTEYEEQKKISIASKTITEDTNALFGGSAPSAISNFQFDYTNILGDQVNYIYDMSPSRNGTMVFFPSKLNHLVYPFYNCKEDRVSISGNICIDTTRVN